jgi:mRNA interferase HigB
MKIVKPARVHEYAKKHSRAATSLQYWLRITKNAKWRHFVDVRSTFSKADAVEVGSGKTVVVFNIAGDQFRLITAIHYNIQKVFVLRFMTHAEYSKDKWKEEL